MRCLIATVVFGSFLVTASQQQPRKILWVGNSLTHAQDLPGLFHEVAAQAGIDVVYDKAVFDGWFLIQHAWKNSSFRNFTNCHEVDEAPGALGYDYVVLQDDSQLPGGGRVFDALTFPDLGTAFGQTIPLMASLFAPCIFGRDHSSGTKIILYQTWGRKDGDTQNKDIYSTFEKMTRLTAAGYDTFAAQLRAAAGRDEDVITVRVGDARLNVKEQAPEFHNRMYMDDNHPSLLAAYLDANVFLHTLFPDVPLPLWAPSASWPGCDQACDIDWQGAKKMREIVSGDSEMEKFKNMSIQV